MQLRCLAVAAFLALCGCAALDPASQQVTAVDGLVAEAVHAAHGSSTEQKAALARAERSFATDASSLNRLRLATLLATLPEPLRNDGRAAALLQPLVDARAPGYGRFAALLSIEVGEHSRLVREAEQAAREHERGEKERDKREEALRQQVEALRGIERSILEREERLRRRTN
ncbi:MAG TPA: hypothetical protein VEU32_15785 [Burkholderiales bacterium]|nr:hypothetical protein [Burkholderiales bacterium]